MSEISDQPYTVLIVDDEPNIRLMLREVLDSEGYRIIEAEDGRRAMEAIERERPNVMLLDLSMPVMDGMRVLGNLRDIQAELRPAVIVLTAYGSISAAVRAMKLGARDFIEKPATPDDIRVAVEQAIIDQAMQSDIDKPNLPSFDETLSLIREAFRAGEMRSVEALLLRAGAIAPDDDAAFLNLAGVFHEASGREKAARKFYSRAIRANADYEPARQNMRRFFELDHFNRTKIRAALGDELQFLTDPSKHHLSRPALLARLKQLFRGDPGEAHLGRRGQGEP